MSMYKKIKASIITAFVLVPLAIMSGCTGDTNTPATTGTGNDSVQGVVVDTVSGQPIAGATVKSGWATVTTDKSGVYNLGTAPFTINTGNITMPDSAYVVAVDTTTATGAAAAGYGSTYFRKVTVSQAAQGDVNILRIGKLNATVKGNVLNANGSFATGATVTLTYVAAGNTGTTQNNSPITTASSLSAVTATDGTYTIAKVEAGSMFQLQARSADGNFTASQNLYNGSGSTAAPSTGSAGTTFAGVTLPPIDSYTFGGNNGNNATNLVFAAAPDGNQPLTVTSSTVTVGAATATSVNAGDFAAGVTTITYNFSRAVKATAYTATTGVFQAGGATAPVTAGLPSSVLNDVIVTGNPKGGNVSYTVAFATDMKSLTVAFTTSPAYVYTVNVNAVLGKIVDGAGVAYNNGAALTATTGVIAFSTSGSPAVGTVSATPVTVPGRGTGVAGDSTFFLAPVTNSIGAVVYVAKRVNGVVVVDYTAFTNTATGTKSVIPFSTNVNLAAVGATVLVGPPPGVPTPTLPGTVNAFVQNVNKGAFETINAGTSVNVAVSPFFGGIDKVDYLLKVVYVNSDKVELPVNTVSGIVIEDKTAPAVTNIFVANGAGAFTGAIPVSGANPVAGRAATGTASGPIPAGTPIFPNFNTVNSIAGGGTAAVAANFSGDYFADLVPSSGSNNKVFQAKIQFNDQMVKSVVEDGTKWGIVDTTNAGVTPLTPFATVTGFQTNGGLYAGNCAPAGTATCSAGIALKGVPTIVYNTSDQTAVVTYALSWTFTQPQTGTPTSSETLAAANVGTGTVYQIGVPNFYFTLAGTDLNNNALVYANGKKGF